MPDWYEEAAAVLVRVAATDKALYREILRALLSIQRNPHIGDLVMEDFRVYVDPQQRFRITYNLNEKLKKKLLVITLEI